jgi:pimeloyl-ACP methyl ester carboxylesterase
MARVRLNGIDFNYEVSGSGRPLLFLNGTGSTITQLAPLVTYLAGSFETFAFDQRGIGESSCPEEPYVMADLAADALALADRQGWETFRVIGVSFGGMVAQELAVAAPERLDRLSLLCTSPGGAGGSSFPLDTLADMEPDRRVAVGAQVLDTRFTPEWLDEHPSDRTFAGMVGQRFESTELDSDRGLALQLQARRGHDVFERLPRITCPTLVASGKYDGIAPLANAEAIASRIPNAELRVYEGGHAFFAQDPRALPDIVAYLQVD